MIDGVWSLPSQDVSTLRIDVHVEAEVMLRTARWSMAAFFNLDRAVVGI